MHPKQARTGVEALEKLSSSSASTAPWMVTATAGPRCCQRWHSSSALQAKGDGGTARSLANSADHAARHCMQSACCRNVHARIHGRAVEAVARQKKCALARPPKLATRELMQADCTHRHCTTRARTSGCSVSIPSPKCSCRRAFNLRLDYQRPLLRNAQCACKFECAHVRGSALSGHVGGSRLKDLAGAVVGVVASFERSPVWRV